MCGPSAHCRLLASRPATAWAILVPWPHSYYSGHPRARSEISIYRWREARTGRFWADVQQTLGRLTPSINLVVIGARREGRTFPDKCFNPVLQHWMWHKPVTGLQLRTGRRRARHLPALGIDFNQSTDFSLQRLDHGRSVRLVLN